MKSLAIMLMSISFLGVGVSSAQSIDPANSRRLIRRSRRILVVLRGVRDWPKAVILLHDGVVNSAVWDERVADSLQTNFM